MKKVRHVLESNGSNNKTKKEKSIINRIIVDVFQLNKTQTKINHTLTDKKHAKTNTETRIKPSKKKNKTREQFTDMKIYCKE